MEQAEQQTEMQKKISDYQEILLTKVRRKKIQD